MATDLEAAQAKLKAAQEARKMDDSANIHLLGNALRYWVNPCKPQKVLCYPADQDYGNAGYVELRPVTVPEIDTGRQNLPCECEHLAAEHKFRDGGGVWLGECRHCACEVWQEADLCFCGCPRYAHRWWDDDGCGRPDGHCSRCACNRYVDHD